MEAMIYLKLLTTIGFKRLGSSFAAIFGLLWLLIEPAALFFSEKLNLGWFGYLSLTTVSLGLAVIQRFPRRAISSCLSSPDSVIEIKVGDLFKENGHLIIGTNDVFDTELGEIIKPSSVQGQFLRRIYGNDCSRLDQDIELAITPYKYKSQRKEELNKQKGKTWRYPIGTTIVLGSPKQRYFLTAYGYMSNEIKVQSNADNIWISLSCLWEQVRLKGNGMNVAIPIIGSDLARTNLPRMALVKLIIISFVVASKKEFIAQKLTVMIYPNDLDSINLYDLEDFLVSACF